MNSITERFLQLILLFLMPAFLVSCSSSMERELKVAVALQSRGDFREASAIFSRVMKREPGSELSLQAARFNAKILLYDLKKFDSAIDVYKYLILYSKSAEERVKSQEQIAQIYFDNLAWYDRALLEYGKILSSNASQPVKLKAKLAIARSYYYLGQFDQSLKEINDFEVLSQTGETDEFDILFLRANILLAQKNSVLAVQILKRLMAKFPERSSKENVPINLVMCYEDLGLFDQALNLLELLRAHYEPRDYIELRIKKINQRIHNQPKKRLKK